MPLPCLDTVITASGPFCTREPAIDSPGEDVLCSTAVVSGQCSVCSKVQPTIFFLENDWSCMDNVSLVQLVFKPGSTLCLDAQAQELAKCRPPYQVGGLAAKRSPKEKWQGKAKVWGSKGPRAFGPERGAWVGILAGTQKWVGTPGS